MMFVILLVKGAVVEYEVKDYFDEIKFEMECTIKEVKKLIKNKNTKPIPIKWWKVI